LTGGLGDPLLEKQIPRARKKALGMTKLKSKRPAASCGPSGGLLWIDQEVVTLRGLYGNSGMRLVTLLTDLSQAESILYSPVVCGL
jgi:hypothetical protein